MSETIRLTEKMVWIITEVYKGSKPLATTEDNDKSWLSYSITKEMNNYGLN